MPVESIYLRFDGLQQDLNDRLRALSELASPERGTPEWSKLEDITHEIAEIYRSEEAGIQFRHQYAKFIQLIAQIDGQDSLDMMMSNLQKCMDIYQSRDDSNPAVYLSMMKLRDHVSLEIARASAEEQIRKLNSDLTDATDSINGLREDAESIKQDVNESTRRYPIQTVTVLSIFSAVVLAFTGGLNFLTGSISGVEDVDIHKLVLVVLIVGFILFNLVAIILMVATKAVGVTAATYQVDIRNPVLLVNVVVLIGVVLVLASMAFG